MLAERLPVGACLAGGELQQCKKLLHVACERKPVYLSVYLGSLAAVEYLTIVGQMSPAPLSWHHAMVQQLPCQHAV